MKNYNEAMAIMKASKTYEFDYSEECGYDTVLEVTDYRTGERVRLDLSRLTEEMLNALQVSDGEDYEHDVLITEQVYEDVDSDGWNEKTKDEVIYSETFDYRPNAESFYDFLCRIQPGKEWRADDGDDWDEDDTTDYCQYVCYPDPDNHDHYFLAVYNKNRKEGAQ